MPGADGPRRWLGPKEWRPYRWQGSPLLSEEENKKFALLEKKMKREALDLEENRWLLGLVKRLSFVSPTDYHFPYYLALANRIAQSAHPMRFDRIFPLESIVHVKLEGNVIVSAMDVTLSIRLTEAVAAIRPYIKVHAPASVEVIDQLRRLSMKLRIDGELVVQGPVDGCLMTPERSFFRKIHTPMRGSDSIFSAVGMMPDGQKADATQHHGLMLPNGTRVYLELTGVAYGDVSLTSGVLGALYTLTPVSGRRSGPTGFVELDTRADTNRGGAIADNNDTRQGPV